MTKIAPVTHKFWLLLRDPLTESPWADCGVSRHWDPCTRLLRKESAFRQFSQHQIGMQNQNGCWHLLQKEINMGDSCEGKPKELMRKLTWWMQGQHARIHTQGKFCFLTMWRRKSHYQCCMAKKGGGWLMGTLQKKEIIIPTDTWRYRLRIW